MLAAKRSFDVPGYKKIHTPLLIPSFSSKGFGQLGRILTVASEIITDVALISAYDIAKKKIKTPISLADLIFLDSGGYETSTYQEMSDLGYHTYRGKKWARKEHKVILKEWDETIPTVAISYDHEKTHLPLEQQINQAQKLFAEFPKVVPELLIKPEEAGEYVDFDSVIANIHGMASFGIIGVTEKQIGRSFLERMVNIARLRKALKGSNLDKPIHIFGSLDPISTPLYFLAGADIFDGLTWLRFSFHQGVAIYKHNYAVIEQGPHVSEVSMESHRLMRNLNYMNQLQDGMKRFVMNQDFAELGTEHREVFRRAYDSLRTELEG